MAQFGKRYKAISETVTPGKAYAIDEALKLVKDGAKAKFVESIDVSIRLGIDAKKSDQGVRGSSLLPHGTGKVITVAVFVPAGEKAEAAKAAGADAVGMEDLAERMQAGALPMWSRRSRTQRLVRSSFATTRAASSTPPSARRASKPMH